MLEAAVDGLVALFQWKAFGLMMIGIGIGFVVGLLPGLGGVVALSLMLSFIFTMSPIEAFAFLLGMFVVTSNTGELTSILFGVPGEGSTAASILDGHPMAKKGEAGRALGASLASSGVGAIIGAIVLAISLPIVRPLVLTFTSPELFALTLLGVTFIAALAGGSLSKGVLMAGFGFLLSTIGASSQSGLLRYTFGQVYLHDGIGLVPMALGLFALPEIIDLAIKRTSIADRDVGKLGGVMQGVRDTGTHFWLVVRCGGLSAFIGLIPGLGSAAAQWLSYAHAVQSSPRKEEFGTGRVEGVLGPGASSNAKEGGALIPTVAFGVPGSLAMAILLGAFIIVGVVPGPNMLTTNLDVTFSMVWVLIIANVISIGIAFMFLKQLARITYVKGLILVPLLLTLVWLGAFSSTSNFGDLVTLAVFGFIGFTMVKLDWPRPPLVLGLVLGGLSDKYLGISLSRYGTFDTFNRPVVVAVLLIAVASLIYSLWQARRVSAARGEKGMKVFGWVDVAVTAFLMGLFVYATYIANDFSTASRRFPFSIAASMSVLAIVFFGRQLRTKLSPARAAAAAGAAAGGAAVAGSGGGDASTGGEISGESRIAALMAKPSDLPPGVARARLINTLAWIGASFVLLWLIGFREGLPAFVFLFLLFESREKWYLSLGAAIAVWLGLWQFFGGVLHFAWATPQVARWFGFDWPGIL